ncbi:hypothetical protein PEC18_19530 [Paucibacter sp. O1-1]|nr:hypothetical protein [Paucibacter sp. O1-1]MDA3827974.1 hypothetical protein [Paucibacter sp. O1-1]
MQLETWAPGLWWLPAQPGEAGVGNRGQVSNLVLAADGAQLWLLGSGPSPAFGRALACQVRRQLGRPVSDLVSPWARPELVLGAWPGRRGAAAPLGACRGGGGHGRAVPAVRGLAARPAGPGGSRSGRAADSAARAAAAG